MNINLTKSRIIGTSVFVLLAVIFNAAFSRHDYRSNRTIGPSITISNYDKANTELSAKTIDLCSALPDYPLRSGLILESYSETYFNCGGVKERFIKPLGIVVNTLMAVSVTVTLICVAKRIGVLNER